MRAKAILCLPLGLANINGTACMRSFAAIITVAFELYSSEPPCRCCWHLWFFWRTRGPAVAWAFT